MDKNIYVEKKEIFILYGQLKCTNEATSPGWA